MIAESYPYHFFPIEVSCFFCRQTQSSIQFLLENYNNARDVLLLALSPEFTAVFGTLARYKRP